ncbi:unnamed protein product [Meganyctiphanes norvegica]|uniref:PDZ domain-containing protein n=1 Tax=Meganyctiphanes norvegica TaxID=48144 RepID=A0AAV2QML7_MEGNR
MWLWCGCCCNDRDRNRKRKNSTADTAQLVGTSKVVESTQLTSLLSDSNSKYLLPDLVPSSSEKTIKDFQHNGTSYNTYAEVKNDYHSDYSSESSSEEEGSPPILRRKSSCQPLNRPASLMLTPGEILSSQQLQRLCPFITESTSFEVTIVKNLHGLGLAVTGGVECKVPWAGLIRIRKLYPQTPAWLCGQLKVGDFVLSANSQPLTGLTSLNALDVMRTTASGEVTLQVCRLDIEDGDVLDGVYRDLPVVSTSFNARRQTHNLLASSSSLSVYEEFEVTLTKVAGSFGLTLCKNDKSIIGQTIKALVKEPAISNGSLRAGDKIISVNNRDMCSLTHDEAIAFLRTCPDTIKLKLYRISEPEVIHKSKPLRQEAQNLLMDIAIRKKSLCNSQDAPGRRLLQKPPRPDLKSVDRWDSLVSKLCKDSSRPASAILDSQLSPMSFTDEDYEDSFFTDSFFNDSNQIVPAFESRTPSSSPGTPISIATKFNISEQWSELLP